VLFEICSFNLHILPISTHNSHPTYILCPHPLCPHLSTHISAKLNLFPSIIKMSKFNYILSLSNIAGIFPLYASIKKRNYVISALTGTIMVASTLMHISETKHQLIGIHPFNKISSILNNIDRIISYPTGIYFIYLSYRTKQPLSWWIEGAIGIIFVRVGEYITTPYYYVPLHLVWHFIVYHLIYRL
jgi:hypothetical protein